MKCYLGIDVGSVSTNLVIIDDNSKIISWIYRRTQGQPIKAVQAGISELKELARADIEIKGVGATGSARYLTGVIVGADIVKNEITAHATAATALYPMTRTIIEIGGQDSKIIFLHSSMVVDFAMNTVCAAGTGSFLDHQAARLGIPIEEFGAYALKSQNPAQIAGRCTVFAESDMIHKQQVGCLTEDIVYGLCQSLVRNYLNNLAKGKALEAPVIFQGGVAANLGIKRAFEDALQTEVVVPKYHHVMGAVGSAILAKETTEEGTKPTNFKGFNTSKQKFSTKSFNCSSCENNCEVVKIKQQDKLLACWGGRCGRFEA
ncbi:MAG: 2-hydroxyglutaryl-CoA dehydratase [Actinobacteria bacterium]|nr:MAG: 2-hydroxyglutaryl-CoA dehydratase [Actinomycetota bacterium]